MAKHFYHIPRHKALTFIKTHKTELNRLQQDTKRRTYYDMLGTQKAYKRLLYTLLEMEEAREGEDVYEAYEVLEELGQV